MSVEIEFRRNELLIIDNCEVNPKANPDADAFGPRRPQCESEECCVEYVVL